MRNPEQTIGNLIDQQSICYVGSVDAEGFPNIKAMMAPRVRKGIRVLYFTTNLSSARVKQFRENPKAAVYFCDRRFYRGVMLTGMMEVQTDDDIRRRIWRDGDTKYYSGGVSDPDYCVLCFTAEKGRFYGNFKSDDFHVDCHLE